MKEVRIVTKWTDKNLTWSASLAFNWVTGIDALISSVLIMAVNVNPTLIDTPKAVEHMPAISISELGPHSVTCALIVYSPCDLLGLQSSVQNPWSSLHH
jgi:hypothetical protein